MVGASGAIFGIIAAFGLIFPNMEMMLLFFPIPIKAKYFVTFYALYELYAGMNIQDSGVAHFAHLGGMIFAYILLKIWKIRRMH
jgi:membrane associated rhomboid family serine protease